VKKAVFTEHFIKKKKRGRFYPNIAAIRFSTTLTTTVDTAITTAKIVMPMAIVF